MHILHGSACATQMEEELDKNVLFLCGCEVDRRLIICYFLAVVFIQCFTKLIDLNKIQQSDATNTKYVFVQKDELHYQVSRTAWSTGSSVFPAVYSLLTIDTPSM